MRVEIVYTDEFGAWWDGLAVEEQKSVGAVVELLGGIEGSSKLRELRIQHRGEPYRVLYAFDPARNAVLLLGGNKTGKDRWYEQMVPVAEQIFADYLRETKD